MNEFVDSEGNGAFQKGTLYFNIVCPVGHSVSGDKIFRDTGHVKQDVQFAQSWLAHGEQLMQQLLRAVEKI